MNLLTPYIYTQSGFVRENILRGRKTLDVGCGNRKLPGAVGVDVIGMPDVDIVHDLEKFPWPFKNSEFDVVFLNHSLEHLDDISKTFSEIHRIGKNDAHVVIQTPYFRSRDAYTDPTHKHFFTSGTFDYFFQNSKKSSYSYVPEQFKKLGFWYGWPHRSKNPFRELVKMFAHSYPVFYDQYLSLFLPVSCITWELEIIK